MPETSPADPTAPLKACELHVHLGGCFAVADLIALAAPYLDQIDWRPYVDAYAAAYGERPDPVGLFRRAAGGDDADLRRHYVFTEADGPDFARFCAKFSLLICIARHYLRRVPDGERVGSRLVLERHRDQGVHHVELRAMYMTPDDDDGFCAFHRLNARVTAEAALDGFVPRYVPSLPRTCPLPSYLRLRRLLDEAADLYDVVPGVDFCHVEEGFPPKGTAAFFRRLAADNDADPARALEVLYHVGEIYFDKSLESAVRWCHEAGQLGARRLGHCTALGLDPEAAVARRGGAHELEKVSERLDQIDYDLRHRVGLEDAGVAVDPPRLAAEREALRGRDADALCRRPYDEARLEEVRRRQGYVLADLARRGTVIESCPSSNMRLGSVPRPELHPVHRFLAAEVDVVIGADDPGIFDSPLAAEVDWVVATTHLTPAVLAARLGDPRRHRLGRAREPERGDRA